MVNIPNVHKQTMISEYLTVGLEASCTGKNDFPPLPDWLWSEFSSGMMYRVPPVAASSFAWLYWNEFNRSNRSSICDKLRLSCNGLTSNDTSLSCSHDEWYVSSIRMNRPIRYCKWMMTSEKNETKIVMFVDQRWKNKCGTNVITHCRIGPNVPSSEYVNGTQNWAHKKRW